LEKVLCSCRKCDKGLRENGFFTQLSTPTPMFRTRFAKAISGNSVLRVSENEVVRNYCWTIRNVRIAPSGVPIFREYIPLETP
jgi:hypothetical protein